MQFTPKKQERVISYLRNSLQSRIYGYGITQAVTDRARSIMKISVACAIPYLRKTDIEYSLRILFAACYVICLKQGRLFDFSIRGSAKGYIDQKLLAAVFLQAVSKTDGHISVNIEDGKIKAAVETDSFDRYLIKLLKKLDCAYFISKKRSGFIIPFRTCDGLCDIAYDLTELISDPFSYPNLWLQ